MALETDVFGEPQGQSGRVHDRVVGTELRALCPFGYMNLTGSMTIFAAYRKFEKRGLAK
jgi:hypothetical protein